MRLGAAPSLRHRPLGAGVARQVGEKALGGGERCILVVDTQVGEADAVDLQVGAAQAHIVGVLAGRGLHERRSGQPHGRQTTHHHHEVGEAGIVGRAGKARAQHQRHHRDPARGAGEIVEHAVGMGEVARILAVLDAVSAAVQHHDQRQAAGDGDLQGALGLGAAQLADAAAMHREILREDHDRPAVDRRRADHDAVGRRLRAGACRGFGSVVVLLGRHQGAHLAERVRVDQPDQPLAGAEAAPRMHALDGGGAGIVQQARARRLDGGDQVLDAGRRDGHVAWSLRSRPRGVGASAGCRPSRGPRCRR